MRRAVLALLMVPLAAAACGGSKKGASTISADPATAVKDAAAKTAQAGSEHLAIVARVAACLGSLAEAVRTGRAMSLSAAAELLLTALRASAADQTGSDAALWQDAGGAALATLLDGLIADNEAAALMLAPADLPFVLAALFADVSVPRPIGDDPRIHIWGTLEARLQSVDCLVLGGLDEGVWPTESRTDPWLSRSMRGASSSRSILL